jgi:serine phosphatase RsbU (regulator of sigma subunit)
MRARLHLTANRVPAGWDVGAQFVPASGVAAADCYDIVCGVNAIAIVVTEAAEQGPAAAAAGFRAKELLRVGLRMHSEPGEATRWVSDQMSDAVALGVTAFVAKIDCTSGTLSYASADHPEAVLCDGVHADQLGPTGPSLGTRGGGWETVTLPMAPGQVLVAYSDGLLAGRTESHARFGVKHLSDVLRANYGDAADVIVDHVLTEAGAFVPDRCHDDIVVAVVARAMPM